MIQMSFRMTDDFSKQFSLFLCTKKSPVATMLLLRNSVLSHLKPITLRTDLKNNNNICGEILAEK